MTATGRHVWTDEETAFLRQHYRKKPARLIAAQLGLTERKVYAKADHIGLCISQRIKAPGFVEYFKRKHAEGWSDSEIARAKRVDRHAVTALRKRLNLPPNALSQHRRDQVRQKTKEQLKKAGLPTLAALRADAFRRRARQAGWPEDLRPRAVQILNLIWERGPQTRKQIAAAIGLPWRGSRNSLLSNDPEGTYLANLMARGLVISLGRIAVGKGTGHSCCVYSLPLTIERKKHG